MAFSDQTRDHQPEASETLRFILYCKNGDQVVSIFVFEEVYLIKKMVQFKYTILYVPDVTKAINFYEAAFGFQRTFITPDNDYGELQTGATTLSFAAETLAEHNLSAGFERANAQQKPFAIELGFVTDDVPAMIDQALAAGASLYQAPAVKPWGQTVAYVRDIHGFLIELCTPVAH